MKLLNIILPFLLVASCSNSLSAQILECADFKDGLFVLLEGPDSYFIERDGNKQFEWVEGKEDEKISSKVEWIDDCKYIISDKKMPSRSREVLGTWEFEALQVEIIKVGSVSAMIEVMPVGKPELSYVAEFILMKE